MITAASTSQFFARILAPRNLDTLSPPDLAALGTLRVVCAILDSGDGISVAGYPSTRIHPDHLATLRTLPEFDRIAYIEQTRDFYTGETQWRLWLLSDWLDSEAQRVERAKYYANASREWLETRYLLWRIACWFNVKAKIGRDSVLKMLITYHEGLKSQDPAILRMLELLKIKREFTSNELDKFHKTCPPVLGHVYDLPTDFYGIPFLNLEEYDSLTT